MVAGIYLFIGAVVVLGLGIGLWLQKSLNTAEWVHHDKTF